jgi:hypothetical protein
MKETYKSRSNLVNCDLFCILLLWTLTIVPVFLNKTQRFRDWLCLRPQVSKKKGQGGGDPMRWVP